MKLIVALACLVVAISATSDQDLWVEFKNNHGKTYRSLREEKLRFNIFQEKLREIESHNAKYEKGEVSYFLGVNQFSDMTSDEFAAMLNKNIVTRPKPHKNFTKYVAKENYTLPTEINWVERGAVTKVGTQGDCGSGWAFSTTGSIEGQNFIRNNVNVPLSQQQLIDCSEDNHGCSGGNTVLAFEYITREGISTEAEYPYVAKNQTCQPYKSFLQIMDFSYVGGKEKSLIEGVAIVGPLSVAVDASLWQSYAGGIFDNELCKNDRFSLNHDALLVGYGKAEEKKYWLIKNSWGESWGEKGYFRMVRSKHGQCGIGRDPTFPLL